MKSTLTKNDVRKAITKIDSVIKYIESLPSKGMYGNDSDFWYDKHEELSNVLVSVLKKYGMHR